MEPGGVQVLDDLELPDNVPEHQQPPVKGLHRVLGREHVVEVEPVQGGLWERIGAV